MTSKSKEIIFSLLLVVIMLAAVGYNVYSVEYQKVEAARQAEEDARRQQEMLEEIKSTEAREIAEFDRVYGALKDEFAAGVDELSAKADMQISSIDELKEITAQRMNASKKLKDGLSQISIPGPLKDYYELEMKFLESDINAMTLVLDYYSSGIYSTFDDQEIDAAYWESSYWLRRTEEEMEKVYRQYGLEYLLES
jgi:hypothetical protein